MIDNPEKFWKRVSDWIDCHGLSLPKFCKEADIAYTSLKSPMDRKTIPGPEILLKIAEYTGYSIEYFITGKDPWTGSYVDAEKMSFIKDVNDATDDTLRRIKAMLDEDRKIIEERIRAAQKSNGEGSGSIVQVRKDEEAGDLKKKKDGIESENPGFAKRLQEIMTTKKVSPSSLARKSNLPLKMIKCMIEGEIPDTSFLGHICKVLGVSITYLETGEEPPLKPEPTGGRREYPAPVIKMSKVAERKKRPT